MNEIITTINEQLQQLQMLMHRTMFSHFGKMHNPHRGQGRVLALLKMKPEISQKELTYLLNMSKQAVAELIAKLEKSGYITREPSEADRRVMTVKLTEEGAKAGTNVDDNAFETAKIFECLNDDELAAFSDYLGRVIKRYEEQFPDEDFEQRRQMMENFMSSYGHGFEHDFHGHGRHFGHGFNPAEAWHKPFKNGGNKNDKDDK
jgi:DNA-binding MarR family transcriptional regulator